LSYYIQDSISVLPDRLRLTVGVMRHYEDLVRSKWMPRYSAVWLMNPNSSLKYTYGVGFRANNTTIGNVPGVGAGSTVPPILMYMNEVNYTQAIRGSGFSLTNIMAAYWMESRNAVRRIVNPNPAIPSTVMQTDVITQKGIEDQVQFKAGPRLSGFVGGRVNRQNKRSYATATGVALVAPYSSKYRFRGGLSFDVLKKLATGVTAEHNGPVVGQETDLTGANYEIFKVHGYTCYNFNLRLGDFHPSPNTSVGYSLYVENLTNRTYYTINSRSQQPIQYLQPPRNYRVSLDVKF
jgi:outer membrane receptor for ferrienterochelin and colicin